MRKTKKRSPIILYALAVAGMVLAYIFYSHFIEPKKVVLESLAASKNIMSMAFVSSFKAEISAEKKWKWDASFDGKYFDNKSNPYIEGTSGLDIESPYPQFNFTGVRMGLVSPEKDVVYMKFENASAVSFIDLEPILGQWILLDSRNMRKENFITDEKINAMKSYFFDAYVKNEFIVFKKLSSQTISQTRSYHYAIEIQPKVFEKFINDFSSAIANSEMDAPDKAYLEKYFSGINPFLEDKEISGEIWIGKKDRYVRKLALHMNGKSEKNIMDASFSLELDDFNTEFEKISPKPFILIEEAFQKITGRELKELLPDKNEAGAAVKAEVFNDTDTDNDGLPDFMEKRLHMDLYNPDSNSNGMKDGEEFLQGAGSALE